jgi:hypothetical protein
MSTLFTGIIIIIIICTGLRVQYYQSIMKATAWDLTEWLRVTLLTDVKNNRLTCSEQPMILETITVNTYRKLAVEGIMFILN